MPTASEEGGRETNEGARVKAIEEPASARLTLCVKTVLRTASGTVDRARCVRENFRMTHTLRAAFSVRHSAPLTALLVAALLPTFLAHSASAASVPAKKKKPKAVTSEPLATPDSEPLTAPAATLDRPAEKRNAPAVVATPASTASVTREETSLVFLYTQSLPSPINLTAGHWTLGSRAAYGVADFVEISSDLVRDVSRQYVVQAKVPILEFPDFIASAFIQYSHFNLHHYDKRNPNYAISAWQPGFVTGFALEHDMAVFIGGNLHLSNDAFPRDAYTSGFAYGAKLNVDWSWMYNPRGGRLSENAISLGTSYDATLRVWGVGITHHWGVFEAGATFYPGADQYKFYPILNISSGF